MRSDSQHALARCIQQTRELMLAGCATEFEDVLGQPLYPRLMGRTLAMLAEDTDDNGVRYEELLTEIPTETSVAERRFLFNFFRHIWHGRYHVLEIGPFLGGTTRAMALGMLLNPSRIDRCRLYTFDKFEEYYRSDQLLACLAPLFKSGVLDLQTASHIKKTTEFQTVFSLLHEKHDYYQLVQHKQGRLPNLASEVSTTNSIFALAPGMIFDAVFVDGCKSWFGTKYFMQAVCDAIQPGSYLIFQDYGAHTCFWIPAFTAMMEDYLKLVAYVDATYTFRLTKPLAAQEIAARFPDSPEAMGRSNLDLIFRELARQAAGRGDSFAMANCQLQHAGAIAYLGGHDEAREKILQLLNRQEYTSMRESILAALQVPTYRPNEGNINL